MVTRGSGNGTWTEEAAEDAGPEGEVEGKVSDSAILFPTLTERFNHSETTLSCLVCLVSYGLVIYGTYGTWDVASF